MFTNKLLFLRRFEPFLAPAPYPPSPRRFSRIYMMLVARSSFHPKPYEYITYTPQRSIKCR